MSGAMESSILTPLQKTVLAALFNHGLGVRGYYLTGGTALSAFYLQHRYSDDLDFFTRKRSSLTEDFGNFREILTSIGLVVTSQDTTEAYARLFIHPEDQKDTPLKIEFARDVPAMMATPEIYDHITVDSFEDIAVNKVCTILSRTFESKDFCDLFFILNESHYSLDYLISRAREKEAAFDEEEGVLIFAINLLTVREFQMLPRMIKPLSLEELKSFFVPLADELIQRLRPRGG
jgi:predicted nucleotidyltransferase component of viral defense system